MKLSLTFFSLITFLISPVHAATRYASPSGTGSGTTAADPTSLSSAIAASSTGDLVRLSAGTFTVPSVITISSGIRIQGAGRTTTIIDFSPDYMNFNLENTTATNVTFTDLAMQNNTGYKAVAVLNSAAVFRRVNFSNNALAIHLVGGYTSSVVIDDCIFDNHSDMAIYDNAGGITRIANSTFTNNLGSYGAVLLYDGSRAFVENNTFTNNNVGVYLYTGGASNSAIVRKNTFDSNDWAIHSQDYSFGSTNTIFANRISNSRAVGIRIMGTAEASLIDSNFLSGDYYGIYISSASTATAVNNLVENATVDGLVGDGSNATFAFNTISLSGQNGISNITTDQSKVVNNIFYSNGNYGLSVDGTSGATSVGNNDSFGNTTANYTGAYVASGPTYSVDPLFVGAGDYRLQAASPLRNRADPALYLAPKDILGHARSPGGVGDAYPEIGAYELP